MMTSSTDLYGVFYAQCDHAPLYAAPWWLDAVCGNNKWEVVNMLDDEGKSAGYIPYYKTQIRGISAIITPPLTQWLPIVKKEDQSQVSVVEFLKSLPSCPIVDLTIKPAENQLLSPFPFRVNFKYSYVIPYHEGPSDAKLNYSEGLRRNLREAEKNYTIASSEDVEHFLQLCHATYRHQKIKSPSWLDHIVSQIVPALKKNKSGHIHFAFDKGTAIAGILTGWDAQTTYYLTGGRKGDQQGASAHALLLDHAIREANTRGHKFDFEGSMHPGIANFFQSFGALPEPYWQVRKFNGIGRLWSLFH
ncbi:MAG: GNAT family N-acetyltransferase [Saprospiraceae bacterium]